MREGLAPEELIFRGMYKPPYMASVFDWLLELPDLLGLK